MKAFWAENKKNILIVFILLFIWRIVLVIPIFSSGYFVKENPLYLGSISLANFDGVHYLNIAMYGYSLHQQAFFPLFPITIKFFSFITHNYITASIIVVYISLFISLFLLFKLSLLDFKYKTALWTLFFFLFFPTSFFMGNVYTESLCMVFILGSFYAARKKHWITAGVLGAFASATRLIGIFMLPALFLEWVTQNKNTSKKDLLRISTKYILSFLLIPIGLISYMFYLLIYHGDALLFIHTQPDFGANRTGGDMIFLPQVVFRYFKIFSSISPTEFVFWIAILEFFIFFIALFILYKFRKKIRPSYLLFSALAIIFPSLTGTFSSIPRYILVAFPIFMVLGDMSSTKTKIIFILFSSLLLIILNMYFTQGHFVA